MATLATKDWIAEREAVLQEARQTVAEISEPIRAEAALCLEFEIEQFGEPTEDEVASGKFRTVIFAAIPADLDELASGDNIPLTNEEIGQNICTVALEVRALKYAAASLNPSFDDCGCAWGRKVWEEELDRETDHDGLFSFRNMTSGERLHGILLDLNGSDPLAAITELLIHIQDEPTPRNLSLSDVFAQHNWRDPVVVHDLALELDRIWERVIEKERA